MSDFDECVAHVAECEQKAKAARNESDRQSWLTMADSWRQTAKLRQILQRQADFIHVPAQIFCCNVLARDLSHKPHNHDRHSDGEDTFASCHRAPRSGIHFAIKAIPTSVAVERRTADDEIQTYNAQIAAIGQWTIRQQNDQRPQTAGTGVLLGSFCEE